MTEKQPKGYTPPKGRPTPKRNQVELANGHRRLPVKPPETRKEARARKKALKNSMTKEEYKAYKKQQREERAAENKRIQQAMDRGDERYMLDRDKGEVRAYVRDWIDSRRFLSNWMMPAAIALLIVMWMAQLAPQYSGVLSLFSMLVMAVFLIEAIFIGKRVNSAVRAKFPSTTETGFGLGFYGYSRSNQPRRWRTPKPRVSLGEKL